MSRTLKRVPMNFAWPLKTVWGGYLNPFAHQSVKCDKCDGSGASPEANLMRDQWYGYAAFAPEDRGGTPLTIENPSVRAFAERNVNRNPKFFGGDGDAVNQEARRLIGMWNKQWSHHLNADDVQALVDAGRLYDLTHTFTPGKGWRRNESKNIPTPDEVNAWSIEGIGHDSINQWVVVSAECKRRGVPESCDKCSGTGTLWPSEEIKKLSDTWEQTEPPRGEGFQLWETTSEGSPVSPVFETIESLCHWCENNATVFGDSETSAEEWRRMLGEDLVCHREGKLVFM